MTCPCCERNARLLTSSEYDDKHDDSMSGETALLSRNVIIERCRDAVKEAANGTDASEGRDRRHDLRVVASGRLGARSAQAVGELETALNMLACRLEAMAEDRALGLDHGWSLPDAMSRLDKAFAAASLPLWAWRLPEPAAAPVQFKQAAE